jgi:hypothetical protein
MVKNKRGDVGVEEVARWLLYIAVAIAAGFAIMRVGGLFS